MDGEDFMARIARILDRKRSGEALTTGDRQELEAAIKGIAPSHPMYRRLVQAMGHGAHGPESDNVLPERQGGIPTPTLDFLMGHGGHWGPGGDSGKWEPGDTQYPDEWRTGPPLSKPGNTRPADPSSPSPAAQHDAQGQNMGMPAPGLPYGDEMGAQVQFDDKAIMAQLGIDEFMSNGGEPGVWSDTALGERNWLANSPDVFGNLLYEGSPTTAQQRMPFLASASELADIGALGGGTGSGDLFAGQNISPSMKLAMMEQAMGTFDQPGTQFIDPAKIYEDVYSRVQGTDPTLMTDDQGNTGVQAQIAVTNQALMNAAPYMSPDAVDSMKTRLDQAALQYLTEKAKGFQGSYPEYLNSIEAFKWMG